MYVESERPANYLETHKPVTAWNKLQNLFYVPSESYDPANRKHTVWRKLTKDGGSFTVEYGTDDILANTVGHVGATTMLHLPFLTLGSIGKNPTREQAEHLYETWKDVPWKGDVQINVGYLSIWNELKRTVDPRIKGRPNIFLRGIGLLSIVPSMVAAKFLRGNFYNPMTKAAYVLHPDKYISGHEIGHAQQFDQMKYPGLVAGLRVGFGLATVAGAPPILTVGGRAAVDMVLETWASKNVYNRYSDESDRRHMKTRLIPALATYSGYHAGAMATDVLKMNVYNPLIPLMIVPTLDKALMPALGVVGLSLAQLACVGSAHVLTRIPYAVERIKWAFGNVRESINNATSRTPAPAYIKA